MCSAELARVCVDDDVYPARLGQLPCCLIVVRDKIGRPANESLVPARGRVAVGDWDAGEDVCDGHPENILRTVIDIS